MNVNPRTSGANTPRPQSVGPDLGSIPLVSSATTQSGDRPLNVTDALGYLDAVKVQFQDQPDVYNDFLDIMKDFKGQKIDTPGVISRVAHLFNGNPSLIQGFNTFLPLGYHIEISPDSRDNTITVTTPSGISQHLPQFLRDPSTLPIPTASPGTPHPLPVESPHAIVPIVGGVHTRSITPHSYKLPPPPLPFDGTYSPGIPVRTEAALLGNLNNRSPVEHQPPGEFNHAIQFLNKIKARYTDDQTIYKQFLDILKTFQEHRPSHEPSQVYAQVSMLFKNAPDLLGEFKGFLPDAGGFSVPVGGATGIPPLPVGASSSVGPTWGQQDMASTGPDRSKKSTTASKRKRRVVEKETTPVPAPRTTSSRSKKAKHHHKLDPASPPFSPYQTPASPQHVHPSSHLGMHQSTLHQSHSGQFAHPPTQGGMSTPDELLFFDRAKKTLESRETYEEFLRLLNMFSKDIIDSKTLVGRVQLFLGDGELLNQFKELIGWDDKQESVEHGPPGSVRTGPPEALSAPFVEDGQGPSYRKLPESEVRLACSGRDELCRSVLNDEWVSHPTWASEEAGFVAHKKNTFEEALHRSEEERHEYHVHIEALTRTIAILDPISSRIEEMSNEERASFRLRPDFGGSSKSIYHRTIKKVYGRDAGIEVIQALQDCPVVAVPVVRDRLKQKHEEWRRAQREWRRTWREVDVKNFYKSLDHQGIIFKQNDKKNITAKHFVADIESAREGHARAREVAAPPWPFTLGSFGHQLEYSFQDTTVLHDSLKMIYSFLDRSQAIYSPQERRVVEKFLRSFIPILCMCPPSEFNAGYGPLEGGHDDDGLNDAIIPSDSARNSRRSTGTPQAGGLHNASLPASDLRKKLLKTSQEKSLRRDGDSVYGAGSRPSSPTPRVRSPFALEGATPRDKADDVWIEEVAATNPSEPQRRPFFANTTFYTLLRLLQLLYSRLLLCKEVGEHLAEKSHISLRPNPIAVELGLDDPNGPSAVLAQAMDALRDQTSSSERVNVAYAYLLDAIEKVYDSELDQATFEEHMRWFFGNKAYHVFTLDKLITALVKQVQTITSDNKCRELWTLLQEARGAETVNNRDIIRYRRTGERHVGLDDHLYRIEWMGHVKTMYIQLIGPEDPSVEEPKTSVGRWREYVDTYTMRHASEWVPVRTNENSSPLFLRRNLGSGETRALESGMKIRISYGTYKMFWEAGSEDVVMGRRSEGEDAILGERAKARHEERLRCRFLHT